MELLVHSPRTDLNNTELQTRGRMQTLLVTQPKVAVKNAMERSRSQQRAQKASGFDPTPGCSGPREPSPRMAGLVHATGGDGDVVGIGW